MENPDLISLLAEKLLNFSWDEDLHSWWLTKLSYPDEYWRPQFFPAENREEAEASAVQYLRDAVVH